MHNTRHTRQNAHCIDPYTKKSWNLYVGLCPLGHALRIFRHFPNASALRQVPLNPTNALPLGFSLVQGLQVFLVARDARICNICHTTLAIVWHHSHDLTTCMWSTLRGLLWSTRSLWHFHSLVLVLHSLKMFLKNVMAKIWRRNVKKFTFEGALVMITTWSTSTCPSIASGE